MRTASTPLVVCALAFGSLALGCGSARPEVQTSSTNTAAMARYKTYAVDMSNPPPAGYSPASRSKTVLEMARPKVEAELGKKGYVAAAEADADLLVHLAAGVKTVADQPTGAVAIAGGDTELDEISTLTVTIVERKSKESLFSGKAKKEVHSRAPSDADVTSAVGEMLEPIPSASRAF
jgi:hypothetical protein